MKSVTKNQKKEKNFFHVNAKTSKNVRKQNALKQSELVCTTRNKEKECEKYSSTVSTSYQVQYSYQIGTSRLWCGSCVLDRLICMSCVPVLSFVLSSVVTLFCGLRAGFLTSSFEFLNILNSGIRRRWLGPLAPPSGVVNRPARKGHTTLDPISLQFLGWIHFDIDTRYKCSTDRLLYTSTCAQERVRTCVHMNVCV